VWRLVKVRISHLVSRQVVPDAYGDKGSTFFPDDRTVETLERMDQETEQLRPDCSRKGSIE
jgi:hypothetical protein